MRTRTGTGPAVAMTTVAVMAAAGVTTTPVARAEESPTEERLVARADVDGDGRRDSVIQTTSWPVDGTRAHTTLTVKGSAGRTSSVRLGLEVHPEFDTPWVGVGIVDGKPGADIAIDITDDEVERFRVFTWRSGRLVSLSPPESQRGHRTAVWRAMDGEQPGGYRFFTVRGVRHVERLVGSDVRDHPRREFRAVLTTYRWSKNTWVPVKTRRTTMPATEKAIRPWAPFTGTGMRLPW
ncbi:hypothetical protein MOPEL_069_00380 [Mobilicoccus pelagius NBRC 104925]|uniref:Uncharacterized protein n=2 Tax=Mobilicoccus TaxID=984996 RepID=H5URC5_9MICO|nr:hypothetical protein MOPEL_069_00380 [Mobilicoccus pelagius NBRC 104925]